MRSKWAKRNKKETLLKGLRERLDRHYSPFQVLFILSCIYDLCESEN